MSLIALLVGGIDLNTPGHYVNWSIFTISLANILMIALMIAIFVIAMYIPFPGSKHAWKYRTTSESLGPQAAGPQSGENGESEGMWTAKIRQTGIRLLPPAKLLPDRQPAYVASWIYIFGVASLAALGIAIVSGFLIALGGTDWWHTNSVGHFFNSLHLWSVELFMAFIVIHLWGKFWMAAWRGRRAMTWMTGVIAFGASIVECFSGYLSQQNFDAQWISTNGKDALNATGVGAFFNLMNFGQMLLWHVVLLPIVLILLVGIHVLMVRVRGVVHPLPQQRVRGRLARRELAQSDAGDWKGPTRKYDIVKEASLASLVVAVLVVILAGVLSSPNDPPATITTWAKTAPADFMATAASELAGTSETAKYGPPYNNGSNNVQSLLFSPQTLAGIQEPIDTANAFVLSPLSKLAATNASLAFALGTYVHSSHATQQAWDSAYLKAVEKVRFIAGQPSVPSANDGPVPELISAEFSLARSGALDADLLAQQPFYGTNFTKPLLFLEDGQYFASLAKAQHLTGTQWGVMNETGSYPGQPWLWLYTLWYQMPGFRNSANVDLIAVYMTGVATILLLGIPFIPGLRDIPHLIPVHKGIWRRWYKDSENGPSEKDTEQVN
ncbi:MAG: cytochrome b N-terminal domain-containing protein [Actinomycetota bacterium]|nr:cytochrome b N-terminal domain-containing protein [Actinomycetota bacterium]